MRVDNCFVFDEVMQNMNYKFSYYNPMEEFFFFNFFVLIFS